MQKEKYICCERTFKTEEELKVHKQSEHKDPLPMWCRGIMGGCVNCGGCI